MTIAELAFEQKKQWAYSQHYLQQAAQVQRGMQMGGMGWHSGGYVSQGQTVAGVPKHRVSYTVDVVVDRDMESESVRKTVKFRFFIKDKPEEQRFARSFLIARWDLENGAQDTAMAWMEGVIMAMNFNRNVLEES